MATRDIVVSILPGGRKAVWGLVLALVALVLVAGVTLEDWACQRFDLCMPGAESATRQEQLTENVARVELEDVRTEPELLTTDAGLIAVDRGTTALLISAGPVAKRITVLSSATTREDVAEAARHLASVPPATLAGIVKDYEGLLNAHPMLAQGLLAELDSPETPEDCAALEAAVWRSAVRSTLAEGQKPPTDTVLLLYLMATALDCDAGVLSGLSEEPHP